ncbi:hypothetical protein BDF20DRAFT_875390 [Mycotypha africana]|uniref:uncharacterized protein n=1 Tax=Mycotypha africana TaxID=64632 RepID=UPI00230025ED|nr:uncharacterized protein BDF20DRAFT_875390 [Mycotypha africana]KAI8977535.1 hypothetical protein BDF20DRAFT_875390 [Mycotypha africana]
MLKKLVERLRPNKKINHDEEKVSDNSNTEINVVPASPPSPSTQNVPATVHEETVATPRIDLPSAQTTPEEDDAMSAPAVINTTKVTVEDLRFYQGGVRKKHKKLIKWVGRIGFIAKAVVYGCIGVLTITNVTGAWTPNGSAGNESPQGAFLLLGGIPSVGRSMLIVIAVGLLLYIIWRMWEAITGQGSDANYSKKKNFFRFRLSPFVSGLVYTAYAYYVIQMIFQTNEEQQKSASSSTFPASWTNSTIGKAGIGILAIAFLIAFLTQIINAVTGNFISDLKTSEPGANKYEAFIVHLLGRIGFGGRAALFGTLSGFFWDSLAEANESGSKNMVAAAISKLANTGGGRFFMVILGLSLVIYAVFAASNAYYKYFPTPPPTRHEYYTHEIIVPADSSSASSSNVSLHDEEEGRVEEVKDRKDTDSEPSTANGVKEAYEHNTSPTSKSTLFLTRMRHLFGKKKPQESETYG